MAAHPGPPEALEEQRCGANEPRSQWSGGWQGLVAAEPQKDLTSVLLRFSRRRAADGPPGPAHKRASKINRLQKSIWPVKSSSVSFTFINASLSLSPRRSHFPPPRTARRAQDRPGAWWVSAQPQGLVKRCPASLARKTEATPRLGIVVNMPVSAAARTGTPPPPLWCGPAMSTPGF